jgi:hypothetical protein
MFDKSRLAVAVLSFLTPALSVVADDTDSPRKVLGAFQAALRDGDTKSAIEFVSPNSFAAQEQLRLTTACSYWKSNLATKKFLKGSRMDHWTEYVATSRRTRAQSPATERECGGLPGLTPGRRLMVQTDRVT